MVIQSKNILKPNFLYNFKIMEKIIITIIIGILGGTIGSALGLSGAFFIIIGRLMKMVSCMDTWQ